METFFDISVFNDFNIAFDSNDIKSIAINIFSQPIIFFIGAFFVFIYSYFKKRAKYNEALNKYKYASIKKVNYIETNNINDILKNTKVGLIGGAGSGKTTLLKQILQKEDSVYIDLSLKDAVLKNEFSFYNFIAEELDYLDKDYIKHKIENGKLRLLIDSFEQLDQNRKESFEKILNNLIGNKKVKFLIAGRNLHNLSKELSKIDKKDISDEQMQSALNEIHIGIRETVLSLKETNKNLYDLIKKPLYLNILLEVFQRENKHENQISLHSLQHKTDFFRSFTIKKHDEIRNLNLTTLNEILKKIAIYEIKNQFQTEQLLIELGNILKQYHLIDNNHDLGSIMNKLEQIGIIERKLIDNHQEIYKFFHNSYRDYYVAQALEKQESEILENYMKNPSKWEEVIVMYSYITEDKDKLFLELLKQNHLEVVLNCILEVEFSTLSKDIQEAILRRSVNIINFETTYNRSIIKFLEIHIVLETTFGNELFNRIEKEFADNLNKSKKAFKSFKSMKNILKLLAKKSSLQITDLFLKFIIKTKILDSDSKENIGEITALLLAMKNIDSIVLHSLFKNIKFLLQEQWHEQHINIMNIFLEELLIVIYKQDKNNEIIKKVVSFLLWNKKFENKFLRQGNGLSIFIFFDEEYQLIYDDSNLETLKWVWRPFYKEEHIINLSSTAKESKKEVTL